MNREIAFDLVEELAQPNEVLRRRINPDLHVAAAVWTAPVELSHEIPIEVRGECLKYAIGQLTTCWPDWELWVVASNAGAIPNNRITRYYGGWPPVEELGIPRTDILESVHESSDGLRCFGVAKIDYTHLDGAHDISKGRPNAIIFMDGAQAKEAVEEVLRRGWRDSPTAPPEEVLEIICPRGGLVVAGYGGFDDPEVLVAAVGQREVLQPLVDMEMRAGAVPWAQLAAARNDDRPNDDPDNPQNRGPHFTDADGRRYYYKKK